MRRLLGRWLAGCLLIASASPLVAQDTLMHGTVTNLGFDGESGGLQGAFDVIVRADTDSLALRIVIGAPLGGSGDAIAVAWRDTLLLRSISATGDTIAWLGWRARYGWVSGAYRIYGGTFEGQGGWWSALPGAAGRRFLAEHQGTRPDRLAAVDIPQKFAPFLPTAGTPLDSTAAAMPAAARRSALDDAVAKQLAGEPSPLAQEVARQLARDPGAPPVPPPTAMEAWRRTPEGRAAFERLPAATPGLGWLGWALGLPLALIAGWAATFGRDLRLLREDRRVLLALVFVPGLYLVLALSVALMLGVAGGVLWLLFLLAEAIHRAPVGIMFAIAVGALLGLVSVLKALWHSVRRAEFPVQAEQLQRAEAPGLYAMLDRLAHRLGATLPDSVVLEMGTSFFVTEAKVRTFTGNCGRRTLCVSAPLLHVLTAAEVEAILAHELAHFTGADTAYSRRFYPVYRGASQALEGMAAVSDSGGESGTAAAIPLLLPQLLVGWYLAWFARLERQNSREREFRADRLAGAATAPAVMASALLKVHAYAPFWSAIPQGIRELHAEGKAFINAALAFEQARETPALLDAVRTGEAHQLTHPTDSHPSLADRLAALGFPDRTTAPLGEGPPATDLVADLPAREERLTDAVSYLVLRQSGLLTETPTVPATGTAP